MAAIRHWMCCISTDLSHRRYLATILKGVKNPHYTMVAHDVVDAILKQRAQGNEKAQYWSREEQERHLADTYEHWAKKGGVWSVATSKVGRQLTDCYGMANSS